MKERKVYSMLKKTNKDKNQNKTDKKTKKKNKTKQNKHTKQQQNRVLSRLVLAMIQCTLKRWCPAPFDDLFTRHAFSCEGY